MVYQLGNKKVIKKPQNIFKNKLSIAHGMYRNLPSWNVVARIGLIDFESCQQTTYNYNVKPKKEEKRTDCFTSLVNIKYWKHGCSTNTIQYAILDAEPQWITPFHCQC